MTMIRVNFTIEFDEHQITADAIRDRFDRLLVRHFNPRGVIDWNARWVSDLSHSPLCGAARQELHDVRRGARRGSQPGVLTMNR